METRATKDSLNQLTDKVSLDIEKLVTMVNELEDNDTKERNTIRELNSKMATKDMIVDFRKKIEGKAEKTLIETSLASLDFTKDMISELRSDVSHRLLRLEGKTK